LGGKSTFAELLSVPREMIAILWKARLLPESYECQVGSLDNGIVVTNTIPDGLTMQQFGDGIFGRRSARWPGRAELAPEYARDR